MAVAHVFAVCVVKRALRNSGLANGSLFDRENSSTRACLGSRPFLAARHRGPDLHKKIDCPAAIVSGNVKFHFSSFHCVIRAQCGLPQTDVYIFGLV